MALKRRSFPRGRRVPYDQIRAELRDGDILLCAGRGVFSTMIQKATRSVWSHVGFIQRLDHVDRLMLLESVEPIGVRTVPLAKYLTDYDARGNAYPGGMVVIRHRDFESHATPAKLRRLTQYAVDQFGYPYDRSQIARMAARILASVISFNRREHERIEANNAFICSEYVARCYEHIKLKVKWNRKGFIAPADFACDSKFDLVGILKRPGRG